VQRAAGRLEAMDSGVEHLRAVIVEHRRGAVTGLPAHRGTAVRRRAGQRCS
jgi:hypothetical protein